MKKTLLLIFLFLISRPAQSQSYQIPDEKDITHTSGLWLGTYTKYRLSKRMFYYGEYHYRRRNAFVKDMAQIYLRFGTTYLASKKFEITTGFVTPIYWAPDQSADGIDRVVMQFRFWEQFLFVQAIGRAKIYHQIRFEQRWRRKYEIGSPFTLTYRFRYKFSTYIPLNHDHLVPKTLFFSFYDEIFIQAGKEIIYNHMEDNRMFIGLGYIFNENFQMQAGYMWTYRHNKSPFAFEHRHIPRVSLYHNLNFHKRSVDKKKEKVLILDEEF
jgi:hypothetical protein